MATPSNIRLLKNDKAHQHRHEGEVDLEPSSEVPSPPSYLSERAKEIFVDFVAMIGEMYTPSRSDLDMIVLYCNNQEQLEHYEYVLRIEGSTFKSNTLYGETIKARPEVAMLHSCKQVKLNILAQFGLSPSARTKVKLAAPKAKKTNPFKDL